MKAVSNTSPLIFASKVSQILELIKKEYSFILISKEVYEEAVEKPLASDRLYIQENALRIKKLIDSDFLKVSNLNKTYKKLSAKLQENIGLGEASTIALAIQEDIKFVLMDEKKATIVARMHNLRPRPISALPIIAFRKKLISKKEAKNILDELLVNQYRLTVDSYKEIMDLLE